MGGWLPWAIVLGGPVLCAAAGAAVAGILVWRRAERRLDGEYDAGWHAGRATAPTFARIAEVSARAPVGMGTEPILPVALAPAEALPALPALHHEGGRHRAPHSAAQRIDVDPAVLVIRAEFARIRLGLGLPLSA